MNTLLDGLDFAIAYLDDIIIISKSKEQHREHVRRVFSRIQEFGFKVKEEKCEFFLEEIKYLGHIIDKDGRRQDPDRATAIKKHASSREHHRIARFLRFSQLLPVIYS